MGDNSQNLPGVVFLLSSVTHAQNNQTVSQTDSEWQETNSNDLQKKGSSLAATDRMRLLVSNHMTS